MNKELETPMMKQYLDIKKQNPNGLLFYRMGDFYELFFEDAVIASKILDITLTKRNKNSSIDMAGVPYHSVDSYISKLIKSGHTVAICEQIGEVTKGNVVERKVTNILTPGTVVEENIISSNEENILVSLFFKNNNIGMSSLNISNGEIFVYDLRTFEELIQEVKILSPTEIICSINNKNFFEDFFSGYYINYIDEDYYSTINEKISLVDSDVNKNSLSCSHAIVNYVETLLIKNIPHLKQVKKYDKNKYVILDDITIKNLELIKNINGEDKGSLLNIIDNTSTCMGTRMLKNWIKHPLKNIEEINNRLYIVDSIYSKNKMSDFDFLFNQLSDIQRILTRISLKKSRPKDLARLRDYLKLIPYFNSIIEILNINVDYIKLEKHSYILSLLEDSIVEEPPLFLRDGGTIKKGYNVELDKLRKISTDTSSFLLDYEEELIKKYNISSLRIKSNKVTGFYIEIPKGQSNRVPEELIRIQTIKNSERYTTDKLKSFESEIITSKSKYLKLEKILYDLIEEEISKDINNLLQTTENIITLDVLNAFAKNINLLNLKKPSFGEELIIKEGRHIVVENFINENFIVNDLDFNNYNLMILTGPNMGGKSTYMRQNALIVILACLGSYVPATYCKIPYVDRIFTRIGASDDLSNGDSTFMVEMKETANILKNATSNSLILMDEVGRGTSTYDGISLAWALVEELSQNIKSKTIFSTHYFELTELGNNFSNIKNKYFSVIEENSKLVFEHKLKEGFIDKSYGLEVAKIAGVNENVLLNAKKRLNILKEKNQGVDISSEKGNNVLNQIININLNKLTPIEALNIIFDIQEKLKEEHNGKKI